MPPLPPVNHVGRVEFLFDADRKQFQEHIYIQFSVVPASQAEANGVATNAYASYVTNLLPFKHTDITLVEAKVTDLTSASGFVGFDVTNTAGSHGATALPISVAASVQYDILRRYRGGKPKTFFGGLSTDQMNDDGTLLHLFVTNLAANFNTFITSAATWGSGASVVDACVNVSYYSGFHNVTLPSGRETSRPTLRGVPVVDIIQGATVSGVYASQRRRVRP